MRRTDDMLRATAGSRTSYEATDGQPKVALLFMKAKDRRNHFLLMVIYLRGHMHRIVIVSYFIGTKRVLLARSVDSPRFRLWMYLRYVVFCIGILLRKNQDNVTSLACAHDVYIHNIKTIMCAHRCVMDLRKAAIS
jgi:hypothetical protein